MQEENHHRNIPLCSVLDSDGIADTSVDTGVDPTESAAYAGGRQPGNLAVQT